MEKNNEVKEAASKYSLQSLEAMEEDIRGFRYKPFSFVKESIMDWTALDFEAGVTWQKEKDKAEYDKLKSDNEVLLSALKSVQNIVSFLINTTPTGDNRNRLTHANILSLEAIKEVESKLLTD